MPESSTTHVGDAAQTLLQPFRLGTDFELPNKILMAPMTRGKATDELVPTRDMAAYYERRAAAGLLITEATIVSSDGQGYPNTPGLYNDAQIQGWRHVVDRVHAAGGRIFVQLWHSGRVSHPFFLDGKRPVAPSAVALSGQVPRMRNLDYGTPRALEHDEIFDVVEEWGQAGANAVAAGFDGVELHGANGYLIDQFLHAHTNRRTDDWGGDPANMTRFPIAVLERIIREVGAERVAIRLSPGAYFNMEGDPGDAEIFRVLLQKLNRLGLAYIHAGIIDDSTNFDYLGGRVTDFLRRHYQGVLVGNGGYTPRTAALALEESRFDLAAIGRLSIANPDLIGKIRDGGPFEEYDVEMLETLH